MNLPLFLLSHLAVLAGAFLLGGLIIGDQSSRDGDGVAASSKSTRQSPVSRAEALSLLEDFLPGGSARQRSRFEQALATLGDLENNEARVRELLLDLPADYLPSEDSPQGNPEEFGVFAWTEVGGAEGKLIAEFEARIAHWLESDRDTCVAFLAENLKVEGNFQNHSICETVLMDYLTGGDFQERVQWAHTHVPTRVYDMVREEMRDGAGFELIDSLVEVGFGDERVWVEFFVQHLPFSSREAVLTYSTVTDDSGQLTAYSPAFTGFLTNPGHPRAEMLSWLNELIEEDRLPPDLRSEVSSEVGDWIKSARSIPYEDRLAALDLWGQLSSSSPAKLADEDLKSSLADGRDWTFEFQHGRVSASEVWEALKEELPEMTPEGEKAARIRLFRTLAEEDPRKAQVLLEPFDNEERRKILFQSTTRSFSNVHPEKLLAFTQTLPPAETPQERADRIKGWQWKTPALLRRFGEDYVEWVLQMPDGPDKQEAQRGLIWQTMKTAPEKAELLRKRLEENP